MPSAGPSGGRLFVWGARWVRFAVFILPTRHVPDCSIGFDWRISRTAPGSARCSGMFRWVRFAVFGLVEHSGPFGHKRAHSRRGARAHSGTFLRVGNQENSVTRPVNTRCSDRPAVTLAAPRLNRRLHIVVALPRSVGIARLCPQKRNCLRWDAANVEHDKMRYCANRAANAQHRMMWHDA